MPFTRRNLKTDVDDVGSDFDGAPDLEFRPATKPLELEQWDAVRVAPGTWRGYEAGPHWWSG